MGITGLLPFVKNASRQANIDEFKGSTVAVDTYCWLHKGAFSCADKLAMGEKTNGHVIYVMKLVNLLLSLDIKPVMVFDGCHLPSKADVEKERRQRREQYKKKAAQFLREGKRSEARECFQRCVDITPQMASDVIKACREAGVDCIVAPYEADAQLTYLNRIGIAQMILTEDSDLIPFGCDKIMYKMDGRGNGILVEKDHLNKATLIQDSYYTFEKFRQMCILSGCDYLTKLPGIGLGKANKVFKKTSIPDIRKVLRKLPTILNMQLTVSDSFIEEFMKAENTFLYQLVFDPLTRKLVPLTPYPVGKSSSDYPYAGPQLSNEQAYQIAIGNVNIYTNKPMDNFDPETFRPKSKTWDPMKPLPPHKCSIWSKKYKTRAQSGSLGFVVERPSTKNIVVSAKFSMKRARQANDCDDSKTDNDLASFYANDEQKFKRTKLDSEHSFHESQYSSVDGQTCTDSTFHGEVDNSANDKDELCSAELDEDEQDLIDLLSQDDETASTIKSAYFGAEEEKAKKPSESLHSPRNIFAVRKGEPKRERLDLNATKPKVKTEVVRSRFFKSKTDSSGTTPTEPVVVKIESPPSPRRSPRKLVQEMTSDAIKKSPVLRRSPRRLSAFAWSKNSGDSRREKKRISFPSTVPTSRETQSSVDDDWEKLRSEILEKKSEESEIKVDLRKSPRFTAPKIQPLRDVQNSCRLDRLATPDEKPRPKRSLQDELSKIIAGSVSTKNLKSKPSTCRSVGLSKKGQTSNKTSVDQPKLTNFLSKFKNEKSVPKLRKSQPSLDFTLENVVDLTEDPVEINYESLLA